MTLALSIRQPWAHLVVEGIKHVENRERRSRYVGPLLIHAGKQPDLESVRWVNFTLIGLGRDALPPVESLPRGGVVGRVDMTGCVVAHDSPWFFGPFGYLFARAQPLPFYACNGRLGFFEIELPAELQL